ncbi:MAG: hypothetical protein U0Y82_14470 [Thermoleophilia bacterium]
MLVRTLIAALAIGAAPAAGAVADPQPGSAPFANPARGRALVLPSNGTILGEYLPFAGNRTFVVSARVARGLRPVRALVKHQAAARPCARTYREDRGAGIAVDPAMADRSGFVRFTSRPTRWNVVGWHRFCVWLTGDPRQRMRPSSTLVRFFRHGAGAVMTPLRDPEGAGEYTKIVSTDAFTYRASFTGCPGESSTEGAAGPPDARGLYELTAFIYYLPGCDQRASYAYRSATMDVTLTLTQTEAAAGVVRSGGICVLPQGDVRPDDAEALVKVQGCHVGRRLRSRTTLPARTPGWVWAFTVNGGQAPLVPTGTTVDLVLNERPG